MSFAHMTHNNETALLGKSQRERAITPWLPIFLLKITNTGLGDGNVVRKTHCSWRGPKFRSQHLIKWLPTICKSSSRSTPSYDLHRHLHVCCVYTYSQTHTYTHKSKKWIFPKGEQTQPHLCNFLYPMLWIYRAALNWLQQHQQLCPHLFWKYVFSVEMREEFWFINNGERK